MELIFLQTQNHVQRHMPGEEGIWVFIVGDLIVFSIFFVTYLYYWGHNVALFVDSKMQLSQPLGVLNTFFMLSSSWFVALAVKAARLGMGRATPAFLSLAFMCGASFTVVKAFEYGAKISAGITLATNDFFMFYFTLTGIHLMHVLVGMAVLAVMTSYTWSGEFNAAKIRNLESGASFWHVVDLLWIVLFALFYLVK